ncbi:MAG: 4-hydroxy-3-methylbut-2-enyl diphosphate reductase [Eubacteriales bacterium]
MEVIRAKTAGFCFGVKRAVDKVYEEINKNTNKKIYTYGPIIHNEEVIRDFENKGVKVLHTKEELEALEEGIVIIRSHGVAKEIYDILEKKKLECVEATCPFVKKIHKIVKEENSKGRQVIIIGNPTHPEVQGIVGWSTTPVFIVQSVQEVEEIPLSYGQKISIVSQTTFNYKKFKDIVDIIEKKSYDVSVLNTICSATKERQTEAAAIAKDVDAMIVVGDKQSSNTQKLFEICKKACNNTYYIQTLKDLDIDQLESVDTVGITAGASTPNNIIEEVQINVRVKF